jgi:hypothetical protein
MTAEEGDGWRSLSEREVSTHEDALFEGVPDHLMPSLIRWITGYLHDRPDLTQRVALRLRVPHDTPDPQQLVEAVRAGDPAQVLDVVDMAIHLDQGLRWDLDVAGPEIPLEAGLADWIPNYRWSKNSSAEAVEQLDQLLEDAGSAFTVDWLQRCLKRRVDPIVTVAAEQTMTAAPGTHLREAWAAIYGRHPDPAKAYDEAIRAVEAAVGDVDRRQVLAVGGNPVGEVMCLVGGQLRVDEDSVPLAGDERRRRRRPQPLLGTGRRVVAGRWR